MRCLLSIVLVIATATVVIAGDSKTPTRLTAEEVKAGWLQLFDGETTFGWTIDGDARAEKYGLILGGDRETLATFTTPFYCFDFQVEFRARGQAAPRLYLLQNGERQYTHELRCLVLVERRDWDQAQIKMDRGENGVVTEIYRSVDGAGNVTQTTPKVVEKPAPTTLAFHIPAGTTLVVRLAKLQPLRSQSLFNGKDLTGWKVHPGKKSKFTVTDQGELNIKDGPGDLQSEKAFGDFVLQLECISNGKHLNSGVFFRCRPGEYQNGYEAQIRNQFTAEPTQKYVIEEFDQKTNKLVAKKEIKGTAVDYGTGAIYRRQPARKEVAKDGEWFTLTIIAHGKHLATWVNGIQVTDWTDNRPLSDNARNGCRLAAGPISLQGHDPTTALSFRNFRALEYPTGEAIK